MTDTKLCPFPGDLVIIEGTATIGVATADVTDSTDATGRAHRVIYRKGRKWVRQWIPESALTVVTRAFDIELGEAYKPAAEREVQDPAHADPKWAEFGRIVRGEEPYAPSGTDVDFAPKSDDELTISRGG